MRRRGSAGSRWGVALAAVLALAAGCGGNSEPEIAPTSLDADRLLYERGAEALEEGDWLRAREYFVQVRDNYPQSQYRADSRLGVADSFEGQSSIESSVSAVAEYQDFLALYPTHERAAYAQYKLGMVHFGQMRGPERDQSNTRDAIREFEIFIQRYPNSELMPDVRERLREARDRLSASELMVGEYYYGRRWWPGAVDRLQTILDTDPAFGQRDAVYYYLAGSQRGRGLFDEAVELYQRLMDEFPESEFVEDAAEELAEVQLAIASRPAPPPEDTPAEGEQATAETADR